MYHIRVGSRSVVCVYMYTINNPNIKIKEVKVYETKYIVKPVTVDDYKKCYESPIKIQATAHGDILRVRAYDMCKSADADIQIQAKQDMNSLIIADVSGVLVGALTMLAILL